MSQLQDALIERLKRAWVTEANTPELLKYDDALVTDTLDKMEQQKETWIAESLESADRTVGHIYELEVERLKYVLTCYLRCRIRKLERQARFILATPEWQSRLSTEELKYAREYLALADQCMNKAFLIRLPEHLQSLSDQEMIQQPSLDEYVFVRAEERVGRLVLDNGDEIVLEQGDLIAIKYRSVQQLVLDKRVTIC